MPRKPTHLVLEHLEFISADVFEQFQKVITEIVGTGHGVYALYHGDRLYYVGLARNLRTRLKAHLRDRHKGLWNRFSVYLTNGDTHLKELESLVLRIVKPRGNRVKGKLVGSTDMKRNLNAHIKQEQNRRRDAIFSGALAAVRSNKKKGKDKMVSGTTRLMATHKGQSYSASLRKDGTVRYDGEVFTSLSAAGKAITMRNTNGRHFWKVRDGEGDWVRVGDVGR